MISTMEKTIKIMKGIGNARKDWGTGGDDRF